MWLQAYRSSSPPRSSCQQDPLEQETSDVTTRSRSAENALIILGETCQRANLSPKLASYICVLDKRGFLDRNWAGLAPNSKDPRPGDRGKQPLLACTSSHGLTSTSLRVKMEGAHNSSLIYHIWDPSHVKAAISQTSYMWCCGEGWMMARQKPAPFSRAVSFQ